MKTAVITGGAGVLCSAFAKALAQDGYAVALLDLDGEMAESLAQEIRQNGGRAAGFQADVLDKDKLLAVREEIRAAFGPCDLLINGAGGNHPSCTTAHEVYEKGDEENDQLLTFFNLPKEQFNFVFDLNLLGTLLPSQRRYGMPQGLLYSQCILYERLSPTDQDSRLQRRQGGHFQPDPVDGRPPGRGGHSGQRAGAGLFCHQAKPGYAVR